MNIGDGILFTTVKARRKVSDWFTYVVVTNPAVADEDSGSSAAHGTSSPLQEQLSSGATALHKVQSAAYPSSIKHQLHVNICQWSSVLSSGCLVALCCGQLSKSMLFISVRSVHFAGVRQCKAVHRLNGSNTKVADADGADLWCTGDEHNSRPQHKHQGSLRAQCMVRHEFPERRLPSTNAVAGLGIIKWVPPGLAYRWHLLTSEFPGIMAEAAADLPHADPGTSLTSTSSSCRPLNGTPAASEGSRRPSRSTDEQAPRALTPGGRQEEGARADIALQSEALQGHEAPVVAAAFSPAARTRRPRTARASCASGRRAASAATTRARRCC